MQRQAGTLRQTIEKYRERTGHYPTRVLADKIYRNRHLIRAISQPV